MAVLFCKGMCQGTLRVSEIARGGADRSAEDFGLRAEVDVTFPERACQAETVLHRFFCVTVALGVIGGLSCLPLAVNRECLAGITLWWLVSVVVAAGSCNRS